MWLHNPRDSPAWWGENILAVPNAKHSLNSAPLPLLLLLPRTVFFKIAMWLLLHLLSSLLKNPQGCPPRPLLINQKPRCTPESLPPPRPALSFSFFLSSTPYGICLFVYVCLYLQDRKQWKAGTLFSSLLDPQGLCLPDCRYYLVATEWMRKWKTKSWDTDRFWLCGKTLTHRIACNLHNLERKVFFPFYGWENYGIKRRVDLYKVGQPVGGWTWVLI